MPWLMLALIFLTAVAASLIIFVVLYRAVSNLFDWTVLTFGNDAAAEATAREIKARAMEVES